MFVCLLRAVLLGCTVTWYHFLFVPSSFQPIDCAVVLCCTVTGYRAKYWTINLVCCNYFSRWGHFTVLEEEKRPLLHRVEKLNKITGGGGFYRYVFFSRGSQGDRRINQSSRHPLPGLLPQEEVWYRSNTAHWYDVYLDQWAKFMNLFTWGAGDVAASSAGAVRVH